MYSHLERKSENILGWYKVRATWGSLALAVTIFFCWFCIICIDTWGGRLCESEVTLIFHWIYASFLQVIISCRNTLEEPLMLGAIFYPFGLETMYQNQVIVTSEQQLPIITLTAIISNLNLCLTLWIIVL